MTKNIVFHDIQQGTEEWHNLRLGKFTASKCKDLLSNKTTAAYRNLIHGKAFERVTGEKPEDFKSDWMQRGTELEPEAIEYYELKFFTKCHNGGFFELNEWVGASPDALVGKDGLVQVKCPSYSVFIDAILTGKIPDEYFKQVQFEMLCADRKWCDLFFYHPKLKPVIHRIERDETVISQIEKELETAIESVKSIIPKISNYGR